MLLEVIAASVEDAMEAEQGGAGRIELVRALERGGMTPSMSVLREIVRSVRIPVRVMLRESEPYVLSNRAELARLRSCADQAQQHGANGLVIGFLRDGAPDLDAVREALESTTLPATFHHAFDEAGRPHAAFAGISREPRIDRVLTAGGRGDWPARRASLRQYRHAAPAGLIVLAGGGIGEMELRELAADGCAEAHVGRAARIPREPHGRVHADRVAQLVVAARGHGAHGE